ncbi:MAG TPA: phosphonate metabolism transcriptional regulator PhnF [Mesorhizobium sp.]|nr:phosphonate metabolism transcriptional regulator PhnF [Mesorhizobium sp.]
MDELDDTAMTAVAPENLSPPLARGDGIAAWRRIADQIEAGIAQHQLQPGAKLPTEAELAERFGVNRHTVRRALSALASEGVVRSARGSGTFVEQHRIRYPIGSRTRFTEIMAAEGHVAGGELMDWETVAAEPAIAESLGIEPGAPVLRLRIRRSSDGVPVAIGVNHLPLPRFEGFVPAFQELGAITPALAACGVTDYRRRETKVSAREATGAEAVQLGLGSGRIVLAVLSVNEDGEGRPIQHTEAVFAADRIELVIR